MTMDARLRARPAERAPTVVKVDEGDQVKILARKGRWLKVSYKGEVGWVTRTQVEDDVTVTKEKDEDAKDSKTNKRRGDSGFDTLDEDARGEDGITEDSEGDDEEAVAEDEAPPKKGKKGKKSKGGDKADKGGAVTVGMKIVFIDDSPVRLRPNAKADSLFKARKGEGMEVIVADDDSDYVRVLARDGSKGWVERKVVASASSEAAMVAKEGGGDAADEEDENPVGGRKKGRRSASADEGDGDDGGGDDGGGDESDEEEVAVEDEGSSDGGAAPGGLMFGVNARVGLLAKAQAFTSGGTGIKANYKLSNSAPAVHAVGWVSKPFGPKYIAQAELLYLRTIGGKGIAVSDGTTNEQLGWVTQTIDVRVLGGYKLSPKYLVAGVVGYHAAQIVVQESTIAALPGEAIKGIRLGAELQAPKLTSTIGLRASIETLLSGKLTQQEGFRDGDSAAMAAYYAAIQAFYAWKPKLVIQAAYQLSYETFAFSGTSQREASAVDGKRQDLQHVILGGVGYVF